MPTHFELSNLTTKSCSTCQTSLIDFKLASSNFSMKKTSLLVDNCPMIRVRQCLKTQVKLAEEEKKEEEQIQVDLSFTNRTRTNYEIVFKEFKPVCQGVLAVNCPKLNEPFRCSSIEEVSMESAKVISRGNAGASSSDASDVMTVFLKIQEKPFETYTVLPFQYL